MRDLLENAKLKCVDKLQQSSRRDSTNSTQTEEVLNVVQYACVHGSAEIVKTILNTRSVYRPKFDDIISNYYKIYDVTGLVPDTLGNIDCLPLSDDDHSAQHSHRHDEQHVQGGVFNKHHHKGASQSRNFFLVSQET